MIIGVPTEIKEDEYRVGITPAGVADLVKGGHTVLIQEEAGRGSGIEDEEFISTGARTIKSPAELFEQVEMIVKVKEPLPREYSLFRKGQILCTFLHLAPAPELTDALLEKDVIAVAYETVQMEDGTLPILTPMSEVAGRMSVQEGAKYLERGEGGRGVLLGGVPGVAPGYVVIIGGGVVGANAAGVALGMGARVTILDVNLDRLRYLDDVFGGRLTTLFSHPYYVGSEVAEADLVVGGVLRPGAKSPHVVTKDMVQGMLEGAVIVDVAIDQGGCVETSRPTSHSKPTYNHLGVIHYCVTNIPGAVGRTSTYALANTTMPYVQQIADKGYLKAISENRALAGGVNLFRGKVTHAAVAESLGHPYEPIEKVLC